MFEDAIFQLRLTWRLLFDERVPVSAKLIPLGAVLYIISPIDIIPDFLIALGLLDDIGVFLMALRMFQQAAPADIVEEHRRQLQQDVTKPKNL